MQNIMVGLLQDSNQLSKTYTLLFICYFMVLVFLLRYAKMEQAASLELKIWILTASFAMLLAVVSFFLKRLLDTFDKKTERIMAQQEEHNKHIAVILHTVSYHKEKLDWLERRIDNR